MSRLLPPHIDAKRLLWGVLAAALSFAAIGTVAALWQNPFFVRMTPTAGPEISFLVVQAFLIGVYVVIRRPACSSKGVTAGSVVSFLGLACPVCNKILLYAFGTELLMTYFEPVRIYVAALGVVLTLALVVWEWRRVQPLVLSEGTA